MYCNQCEQTAKGIACITTQGSCGKTTTVSDFQDVVIYLLRGLSKVALHAQKQGKDTTALAEATLNMLFSTVTNVNFDEDFFLEHIPKIIALRDSTAQSIGYDCSQDRHCAFSYTSKQDILAHALDATINPAGSNEDILSLQQILLFGLKGAVAYAWHAKRLGKEDAKVYSFIFKALAEGDNPAHTMEEVLGLCIETGNINFRIMQLLDEGHTEKLGTPVPTEVRRGHRKNKAILVSGHDLEDLEQLLQQTEGKGIDIYTHGEMLPAHGYPVLKAYPHLYGNFGGAWQDQQKEFKAFPGPILFTTNCIIEPQPEYASRVYTTGVVGWNGIKHVQNSDFSTIIKHALECEGFTDDNEGTSVHTGFGHKTVLSLAPQIIDGVKKGTIKHFFLVGGCDGAKSGRNYFSDVVANSPKDSVILTLGCGKFRFIDQNLGTIAELGIPRMLDMGQCNDAYSAIQVAVALADAFGCSVNELPLTLVISWFEQKAVAVFLTLLALGLKNFYLGPTLPAFVSKGVLEYLITHYNIAPTDDYTIPLKKAE